MNALMKLTAVALGALGIAGGAAVAQGSSNATTDARSDTANYGTPPGAPLKRDGSLSSDRNAAALMNSPAAADTSSTATSTDTGTGSVSNDNASSTDNSSNNNADTSLQPRSDRN